MGRNIRARDRALLPGVVVAAAYGLEEEGGKAIAPVVDGVAQDQHCPVPWAMVVVVVLGLAEWVMLHTRHGVAAVSKVPRIWDPLSKLAAVRLCPMSTP